MSELGQKATIGSLVKTVRFRGLSSRPISTFSA